MDVCRVASFKLPAADLLATPALIRRDIPTFREFLRREGAKHQVFQHHFPLQDGLCRPVLPVRPYHPRHA